MFCEIATSAAPPRNDKSGDLCGRGSAVRKRVPNDKKDRRRAILFQSRIQSIPSTVTFSHAVGVEFGQIFLHPFVQLVIHAGIRIAEIAARQLLCEDVKKYGVFIVCNGLVDAAVLKGPRRERDAEPLFHERGQRRTAAQAENFAFNPVVLRDAVVLRGRSSAPSCRYRPCPEAGGTLQRSDLRSSQPHLPFQTIIAALPDFFPQENKEKMENTTCFYRPDGI